MSQARRRRGRDTELAVAKWFQVNGWPYAEAVASAAQGADLTGTPDLSVEIKARRDFDPGAWLRQGQARAGLSIVTFRLNGQGTSDVGQYPALLRLADLVPVLRAAGYGDPNHPGDTA